MTVEPASVATALGVGGTLGALSLLGLEPGPIFWALWGACIGMSWAAPSTRKRAIIVFVSVVLISSLLGVWAAVRWFNGEAISRNFLSCVVAAIFHPGLNWLMTRLSAIGDAALSRIGGGGPPK